MGSETKRARNKMLFKGLCNNHLEREGGWERGEICPKTTSPSLSLSKNQFKPPSHNDNIKASTYVVESFEESPESLDSKHVSSSHELGDSSSFTVSLALRFPPEWVRTQEFLSD